LPVPLPGVAPVAVWSGVAPPSGTVLTFKGGAGGAASSEEGVPGGGAGTESGIAPLRLSSLELLSAPVSGDLFSEAGVAGFGGCTVEGASGMPWSGFWGVCWPIAKVEAMKSAIVHVCQNPFFFNACAMKASLYYRWVSSTMASVSAIQRFDADTCIFVHLNLQH
jgi:hypothetical protein